MNFEKLDVWKRSSRLCADIYKQTISLKDFGFRDQLTRAALSVPSNIAEGMTRESVKEKKHFLNISRASLAEARTQIYIGIDIGYLNGSVGKTWIEETKSISAMLTVLRNRIDD